MTELEKAARMALEALESYTPGDYSTGHVIHPSCDEDAVIKAITALRSALKQPAQQEPVEWLTGCPECGMDSCECGSGTWNPPPAQQEPLSNGEIYTAYITATNQTLRAQDERLAFAFARAVEQAHGITGEKK